MVCLLCRRVWEQPPLSTVSGCRRAVGAPRVTRAMPGGPPRWDAGPGPRTTAGRSPVWASDKSGAALIWGAAAASRNGCWFRGSGVWRGLRANTSEQTNER